MAKEKRRVTYSNEGNLELPEESRLPGHAVDALLASGDVEGARAEFERLCLEGLDSGDPISMTPEKWEEFRRDLHRKAKLAS